MRTKDTNVNITIVETLKESLQGSEFYNEPIFCLFSALYHRKYNKYIYTSGKSWSKDFLLGYYKKFYNNLEGYLQSFNEEQREILIEYYGLRDGVPKTIKYLSETKNLSNYMVSRYATNCLSALIKKSFYREVDGRLLDNEEYRQYLIDTKGEFYVKAIETPLEEVVGVAVGRFFKSNKVNNVLQLREFLVKKFDKELITEEDLISVFMNARGVAYKKAECAVEVTEKSGYWDYLTKGIQS